MGVGLTKVYPTVDDGLEALGKSVLLLRGEPGADEIKLQLEALGCVEEASVVGHERHVQAISRLSSSLEAGLRRCNDVSNTAP